MPNFNVTGHRQVSIRQTGEAWVEADTEDEARELAENDPDSLEWDWDEVDPEDGDIDSIEIDDVMADTGESEAEEAEEKEGEK